MGPSWKMEQLQQRTLQNTVTVLTRWQLSLAALGIFIVVEKMAWLDMYVLSSFQFLESCVWNIVVATIHSKLQYVLVGRQYILQNNSCIMVN